MGTIKIAKRYAQGLLEYTKEVGSTDVVFNEMKDFAKTISEVKEFFLFTYYRYKEKTAYRRRDIFLFFFYYTKYDSTCN